MVTHCPTKAGLRPLRREYGLNYSRLKGSSPAALFKGYLMKTCTEEQLIEDLKTNKQFYFRYNIPLKLIEKYSKKLDWRMISLYQKGLTQKFIEKHSKKIVWDQLGANQKFTEKFMLKHATKLRWDYLLENQVLSENFIAKYHDLLNFNWHRICQHQKLSQKFIERFQDYVNWLQIVRFQKITKAFRAKHNESILIAMMDSPSPGECLAFQKAIRERVGKRKKYTITCDETSARYISFCVSSLGHHQGGRDDEASRLQGKLCLRAARRMGMES